MKILIVGAGKVGYTLAEHLSAEKHDVIIIDSSETALERASNTLDVMCVRGNGASIATLREAGAQSADILIAATSLDEVNMICCVAGKRLGANYTIARIRDKDYSADFPLLKENLGIDMAINPEYSTAVEITRLLRFPISADNIETFYRGRVELVGFHAQEGDFIVGQPLSALSSRLKKASILFCAAEHKGVTYIPNGSSVFHPGDQIYVIGDFIGIPHFFRSLGRIKRETQNVFITGGGRIAYYLARFLEQINKRVTIIERDEETCRRLSETLSANTLIIHGDGTDQSLLEAENLQAADAFVALTDQDESNLITALCAIQMGVPKVVAKVTRQNYDAVAHAAGVDSIISPKLITAGHILRTVRGMQQSKGSVMQALYKIAGNSAEAMEFIVKADTRNLGVPFRELKLRKDVIVAALVHNGMIRIPDGDSCIQESDSVIIVSTRRSIVDLNDIFEGEA